MVFIVKWLGWMKAIILGKVENRWVRVNWVLSVNFTTRIFFLCENSLMSPWALSHWIADRFKPVIFKSKLQKFRSEDFCIIAVTKNDQKNILKEEKNFCFDIYLFKQVIFNLAKLAFPNLALTIYESISVTNKKTSKVLSFENPRKPKMNFLMSLSFICQGLDAHF